MEFYQKKSSFKEICITAEQKPRWACYIIGDLCKLQLKCSWKLQGNISWVLFKNRIFNIFIEVLKEISNFLRITKRSLNSYMSESSCRYKMIVARFVALNTDCLKAKRNRKSKHVRPRLVCVGIGIRLLSSAPSVLLTLS